MSAFGQPNVYKFFGEKTTVILTPETELTTNGSYSAIAANLLVTAEGLSFASHYSTTSGEIVLLDSDNAGQKAIFFNFTADKLIGSIEENSFSVIGRANGINLSNIQPR